MGLFNKNKKGEKKGGIPPLPELPELPELPRLKGFDETELLPRLPSFPNNSFGEKFSQNTIKEAVSGSSGMDNDFRRVPGEKEDEEFDADEFADENETQMMRSPPKKHLAREVPREFREATSRVKKIEPVFIRLDKFEESMQIIEKTKKEIKEIEEMLADIQKIKEEEEKELQDWETSLQNIKKDIEKIDSEIFSKIGQ